VTAEPAGSFRCSSVSLSLDEPLFGTASTVRSWILLEQPGPWGPNALIQSRLPRALARELRSRARDLGIRVVLIRRSGRYDAVGRECYLSYTGTEGAWVEHAKLDDPAELLDVDLTPLASGEPVGLGRREARPVYLVCTNGRRDPCCAERGRPLAAALEPVVHRRVWECSHIGGDRFAGNLVCFPHGDYFGRVTPEGAVPLVREYERGLIDLDLYRGRSAYGFAVQAAEGFLRRRLGLRGIDDVRLAWRIEGGDGVTAEFRDRWGASARVRVTVGRATEPRPLTCHGHPDSHPLTFDVVVEG
jgi:hypothetical protein